MDYFHDGGMIEGEGKSLFCCGCFGFIVGIMTVILLLKMFNVI